VTGVRWFGLALALAAAVGEGCVLLAWRTTGSGVVVVLAQLFVVAVLVVTELLARYAWLRARHLDQVAARAVVLERSRLAEDMHDLLGHELSLIAVQAGALQLSHPDTADRSAAIRVGAEHAVLTLREIVSVLPTSDLQGTREPGCGPLEPVLSRAREAGMTIDSAVDDLDGLPPVVRDTLTRLVREAVTKAGRHAAGAATTVRVHRRGEHVAVEIRNDVIDAAGTTRIVDGNGLGGLRRRLALLGGTVDTTVRAGAFVLQATVPTDPALASTAPPEPSLGRPSRAVVGSVVIPVVAHCSRGCSATTPGRSTTPRRTTLTMTRVTAGMTERSAQDLLPGREAPVRLSEPPRPASAQHCRYYTDGNFPVGYAAWRVCFGDGAVRSVDDLR